MKYLVCVLGTCLTIITCTLSLVGASSQEPFSAGHVRYKGGVGWDGDSLIVRGERIVIWSGEFHTWRLPVPSLWLDVLQKIKALGFNAVSFYSHWGLNNPAEGVLDFEGFRGYQSFLDACVTAGLYVIARPGPYINAETTGGGIPGWVLALNSSTRTSDPVFRQAYTPYWTAMGDLIAANQIEKGGSIIMVQIENEYYLDKEREGDLDLDYIMQLEKAMIDCGVEVPLSFNDVGMTNRLVKGPGSVDLYGFDSYPQSLSASACGDPYNWKGVDERYEGYFKRTSGKIGVPYFIPEFQGGTINQWTQPVVEDCQPLFGKEFERVYYLHNLAMGVKMHNVYMVYGGTNFGGIAFPPSTTSYDYFAAIREDRTLRDPKYSELKVISLFLRNARDFPQARVSGKKEIHSVKGKDKVLVTELKNGHTGGRFYIVRHSDSNSLSKTEYKIQVKTSEGHKMLPHKGHLLLDGRDSRIIVTDFHFGQSTVLYSTASIMIATTVGDEDVLLVYGSPEEPHEIAFADSDVQMNTFSSSDDLVHSFDQGVLSLQLQKPGMHAFELKHKDRKIRLLFADTATAYATWQPVVRSSSDALEAFWSANTSESAIVVGPYLVRDAYRDGNILNIIGDLNVSTSVLVVASPLVEKLQWNGDNLNAKKNDWGAWEATLAGPEESSLAQPILSEWRHADSLPEIEGEYDDSHWVKANHTMTNNPFKPYANFSGQSVLYGQDYNYHQGNLLFRGHFYGTGKEKAFSVSLSPGRFGAGSVWLNGNFLGSGSPPIDKLRSQDVNLTFPLDSSMLNDKGDNILLVLTDHMGYEEADQFNHTTEDVKSPRGIRGYELTGGGEIDWKIQGNLGGNWDIQDQTRSMLNEGGLFAERERWHLPEHDFSSWPERLLSDGMKGPGVGFYKATFDLSVPNGMDLVANVVYPDHQGYFRSQLWVNGWMLGKRVGDLGPQLEFPIPPGILRNGTNTLAVSHWALSSAAEALSLGAGGVQVKLGQVTTTGYSMRAVWSEYAQ